MINGHYLVFCSASTLRQLDSLEVKLYFLLPLCHPFGHLEIESCGRKNLDQVYIEL
jgi:hypothetical protein